MERCLTIYRNLFASEYDSSRRRDNKQYLLFNFIYLFRKCIYCSLSCIRQRRKVPLDYWKRVNKASDLAGRKDTKLVGITTDGKSADTGKQAGLWRPLADQVQRGLATF